MRAAGTCLDDGGSRFPIHVNSGKSHLEHCFLQCEGDFCRGIFHSLRNSVVLAKWDAASEKIEETVEMRPCSVVGCNSYGLNFPPCFDGGRVPAAQAQVSKTLSAPVSQTSLTGNRTEQRPGVIQEYRNGNE